MEAFLGSPLFFSVLFVRWSKNRRNRMYHTFIGGRVGQVGIYAWSSVSVHKVSESLVGK